MTTTRAEELRDSALVDAANADPAGFRRRAAVLLRDRQADPAGRVAVRWALGLALRELGELDDARRELDEAAGEATAIRDHRRAALIRSSLATVLLHLGQTDAALNETISAAVWLEGVDGARNEMQRGVVLQRLGRQDEAVAAYDRACPELRASADRAAEARLLSNRGILHAYRGDHDTARADLERSVGLARAVGSVRGTAIALQNLGFVAGRQGHIPEALGLLDEADQLLRDLAAGATSLAMLDGDRAEILADAGLVDEAVARARVAVRSLSRTSDRTNLAEAELLLARTLLMSGDYDAALDAAAAARGRFAEDDRKGWELQARYVALDAAVRRGDVVDLAATERLTEALAAGGWAIEARVARLRLARQALARGDVETAERVLTHVRQVSRTAPALARAQAWHATALVRDARGDRSGARRAVTTGLELLHRSRLLFASAELRAHAAAHTAELVELAVRSALEDGRPASALVALDRVRATDVAVRAHPPQDEALARDLAELRRLHVAERDAARAGDADLRAVVTARAQVERRIRDRTRTGTHETATARRLGLDVARLRRTLDGRTLAAYLHLDGDLHVITVSPRATRHHRLGSADEVRTAIAHLRSALRRLAYGRGSARSLAAADGSVQRSAGELRILLGLDAMDPDGLVIVPAGALDGMPWGVLAAITGHVPTIAPSARAFLEAATRDVTRGDVLLAAGPDLTGAVEEVLTLRRRYPGATVLTGPAATATAVREAMEGTTAAHVAAHGSFRADNPLFSALHLADGPLTVYELESLRPPPQLLVLSSCEAAATTTLQGDAVLGLSSVLLRLGVTTLIAPVLEIPDETAGPLMVDLHTRLAAGEPPADALAGAVAAAPDGSPQERAVRAAFVVMGASEPEPDERAAADPP